MRRTHRICHGAAHLPALHVKASRRADFPGLEDEVQRDFGNPGSLPRACQHFLRWLRLLQRRDDQGGGAQRAEIPGQWAVIGACQDGLAGYWLPRYIAGGNLTVATDFPPDGGDGIDVLDRPARRVYLFETAMRQARP